MPDLPPAPSSAFLAAFRRTAGAAGRLSFAEFMRVALYDSAAGYYRAERRRVGRSEGTDFYTASTSGPVFGELVASAAAELLGGADPQGFTFVELGAEAPGPGEPAQGILAGVRHPFGASRTVALGQEIVLSGSCVVFANELFDAQPFERFAFRRGAWRRLGVAESNGSLGEVELAGPAETDFLPAAAPEGYVFDAPLAATKLLEQIAGQPWSGLFLTCDYGRALRELLDEYPAGTARAYHRHRQSHDLLAQPGEQDLTCHVCWDWLAEALRRHGFAEPRLETQEAFFVKHAGAFLAEASATEATRLSQRKLALMQLIHPAHLGQKFQVLHARRPG